MNNMNWKTSLDKYLTSPPKEDGYDIWVDCLIDTLTDSFYERNEDWINDYKSQFEIWCWKLYKKDKHFKLSAKIIERAFHLYKLKS